MVEGQGPRRDDQDRRRTDHGRPSGRQRARAGAGSPRPRCSRGDRARSRQAALAIRVDGELRDLSAGLEDGARVEILTDRHPEALDLIRHDAAHVMATAVQELYPGTKVTIGPAIEGGFYYDFDFPEGVTVTEADLPAIE
ncbi:MAG: hypothetical protein ACO3ZZ_04190, partial [Solirubrobacterales bacterium]